MASQTPAQVSVLQRVLAYFQLAASIGMEVPDQHIQAISTAVENGIADLEGIQQSAAPAIVPVAPASQTPAQVSVLQRGQAVLPAETTPPAWFEAWLATQKK